MLNIATFNMNIQHSISIGRIEMKEIKSTLKVQFILVKMLLTPNQNVYRFI